jgi:ribosomal protein S18 acetylase RimI-like enzyme
MPLALAALDHLAHPVVAALLTRQREHAEVVERPGAIAVRARPRFLPMAELWAERLADGLDALAELVARHPATAVVSYDPAEQAALADRLGASPAAFVPPLVQMVFADRPAGWPAHEVEPLGAADLADMQALVDLARPGPFGEESPRLGRFVGIRRGGRLVAMGGLRIQSDRVAELTAISTHPEARGRGLASQVVAALVDGLLAERRTPFLHVAEENATAIRVYQRLGFRITRRARVMLIQPGPTPSVALSSSAHPSSSRGGPA